MAKEDYQTFNFKLHKIEDADLIDFLKNVPKTFFIKSALRHYIASNPSSISNSGDLKIPNREEREKVTSELITFD
jgi:endo-1,4-beta-mannosidase